MWKIYSRNSKQKRTLAIPQDLVAASDAAKKSQQMYKDSPALLAICLRGKEEPFKKLLRVEWAKARASPEFRSSGATSNLVYTCLEKVIHRLAAKQQLKALDIWALHVGKNVSHHSGWLATLQKIHILQKVTSWSSGVLVFGRERGWYRILPFGKPFESAFQRQLTLGKILQAMPLLLQLLLPLLLLLVLLLLVATAAAGGIQPRSRGALGADGGRRVLENHVNACSLHLHDGLSGH